MMQSGTLLFELAVASLLVSSGSYLQHSGMPGTALALTGLLLGVVTVLSRTGTGKRLVAGGRRNGLNRESGR
jgi:hypothetical protein